MAEETATKAIEWHRVCALQEIPKLGARVVRRAGDDNLALFRTADDEVFGLVDRCPHRGGPLSQGIVFGRTVACPLHGWNIGLSDGQAVAPDVGCAHAFAVKTVDGDVYLDAAALHARSGAPVA